MGGRAHGLVEEYVECFNAAVRSGDFLDLLRQYADDAVIRFENVPGTGELEFVGRAAYTQAYETQPPDDEIELKGPVNSDGETVVASFRWRTTGEPGTMQLTRAGACIVRMVVRFGEP